MKRHKELEKKGLTRTRKDLQQRREIRKEMEDAMTKKEMMLVINYTPSFRKIIPDEMNPYLRSIYIGTMKEIVDEHNKKRKKEAAVKKREKER
jgi:hypothetical protein